MGNDTPHATRNAEREAESHSRQARSVQVHLRLTPFDYSRLRLLAKERDQTLSATVRHLLNRFWADRNRRNVEPS